MKSRICPLLSANQGGGKSLWSAYGRLSNLKIPTTTCLNQSPSPNRKSSRKVGRCVAVLSAIHKTSWFVRMAAVIKMFCSVLITALPIVGSTDMIPI